MATLPDANALGERPVPQASGAVASYEATNWRQVGMAGQAVSGAGRELEQASDIVAQTTERQDSLVAQDAANKLNVAAVQQQYDPKTGWANAKEGQAVGQQFITDNTQRFTDQQTQIRDNLQTENQKKIFDQHAAIATQRFTGALMAHQAQQTDAFNTSTENSTINNNLASMARAPTNELNFQTGLAAINGTIDQSVARRGLPAAAATDLKAKYLDAAYTTRILAIKDGIPGVVQASPYLAESMFKQVQDKLLPESQVRLAVQVQKSVQDVQGRDTAQQFIFGKPPSSPAAIAPAVSGAPLQAVVMKMESGGRTTGADGQPLQGPMTYTGERAQGGMQVMPATSANPGYGVKPAQLGADGQPLPGELERVGRDYLGAMTARYDNPALVMAAYNAGPGVVDDWLHGTNKTGKNPSGVTLPDPRSGAITTADFAARIPFAETMKYVTNGLHQLNANAGAPNAPIQPPTANNLKVDLYSRVQAARALAEQQYPGDTAYADSVASRVENLGRTVIANQQGVEAGARDQLFAGLIGPSPNGSQAPLTIDQLLTDPQMRQNWDNATPETRLAIQNHFKNGGGDPPRTLDTQRQVYRLQGMAVNDRAGFASMDLSPLIGSIPHADFQQLSVLQMGARNKTELAADKSANLTHAMSLASEYALKPIGLAIPDKNTGPDKRAQYDQFTGAFQAQIDAAQTAKGKPLTDSETVDIAKRLTTTLQVPGSFYGHNDIKAYQVTADNMGSVTAKISDQERAAITGAFTARGNAKPTEAQIQTAYLMARRPDLRQKPGAAP